jgi:predicted PurR-regulated permease PerM
VTDAAADSTDPVDTIEEEIEVRRVELVKVGMAAWSIIGIAIVVIAAIVGLAAVSQLVLPLMFAVMIGAAAYPLARKLHRYMAPSIAAAVVVAGMVLLCVGVVAIVVHALVNEVDTLTARIDDAIDELSTRTEGIGLDQDTLTRMRESLSPSGGTASSGYVSTAVSGLTAVFAFFAGVILAVLILYYVLKDGPDIRDFIIAQAPPHFRAETAAFLKNAVTTVRAYWMGRALLSAAVTAVVVVVCIAVGVPLIPTIAIANFFGGFVPYVGAFIGGGLATLLALSDGGITPALIVLGIVLVANLVLENLLEPRIMSGRLHIHPLLVLIATTTGGVVGGMAGLILAVPIAVVGLDLIVRIRRVVTERNAPATRGAPIEAAVTPDA